MKSMKIALIALGVTAVVLGAIWFGSMHFLKAQIEKTVGPTHTKNAEMPGQFVKVYFFAPRGTDWFRFIGEKWPTKLVVAPNGYKDARTAGCTGVGIEQDRHLFLVDPSTMKDGKIGIRHLYLAEPVGDEDQGTALRRTAKLAASGQLKPVGEK